jgi:hypothetical protein
LFLLKLNSFFTGHRKHSHHHHHHHRHQRASEVDGLISSKNSANGSTAYLVDDMEGGDHLHPHHHHVDHHHAINKEKEVSFANGIIASSSSPPTPSRSGFIRYPIETYPPDEFHNTVQNNEAYPCDCCRLEDQYYPNVILHPQRRHQVGQFFCSKESPKSF